MMEIIGFDAYLIDEDGNIFSKKTNRFKKHCVDKDGYLCVYLRRNGKTFYRAVHRLVAENFIPNPENKPQVNHIDCDPLNPHKNNLEWVSQLENNLHTIRLNRRPKHYNK